MTPKLDEMKPLERAVYRLRQAENINKAENLSYSQRSQVFDYVDAALDDVEDFHDNVRAELLEEDNE